jgi:cellobiose phosphorylase
MIAGKDAVRFGESKNSWLTGTAAWNFVDISQAILGVHPTLDGLSIDPCIPKDWKGYTVTRKYRGVTYVIRISNPDGVEHGIRSMTADGQPVSGNLVPIPQGKDTCSVDVVMG